MEECGFRVEGSGVWLCASVGISRFGLDSRDVFLAQGNTHVLPEPSEDYECIILLSVEVSTVESLGWGLYLRLYIGVYMYVFI